MKSVELVRRQFLKYSGATAILAGIQPQLLLAADDPMAMATFLRQRQNWFHFYDAIGQQQANLWLWTVSDLSIEDRVEQFSLTFLSILSQGPALPDGVYNVTTPDADVVLLNTERQASDWRQIAKYTAIFGLLQE